MQLNKVPFSKTQAFSDFFLDYVHHDEKLRPFYGRYPDVDNFKGQILEKQKSFPEGTRDILVRTLQSQYAELPAHSHVRENILRLLDNSAFTVVTGHQLNVCTGPLYFIYKIVTVINACKRLSKQFPAYSFIPVYWMASEDHDYEEINSFRMLGEKYRWQTDQHGAVGRFSTMGLPELMNELPGDVSLFKRAYKQGKSLSGAVRIYVNELFGSEGLVVIDADDSGLKSIFKPIIIDDLINHSSKRLIDNTNLLLEDSGYKPQVYCREINLFYLDNDLRDRVEQNGQAYHVSDSNLTFSRDTILKAVDNTPEKFSPNVILRPVYQEMILPNLAYTGGPAEIVYWLQLKAVFEHYQIPFPILLPRNFALIIEGHILRKFLKTGLHIEDLFQEKEALFRQWILSNTGNELSVQKENKAVRSLFEQLRTRSENVDKTLGPHVTAVCQRTLNQIANIEKKLIRAQKRANSEKLGQIESVKEHLFPNGSLQERVDNFLNFYQSDPRFIHMLLHYLDPFDFQFNVLTYTP